jgi:hypothetical protein
MKHFLCKTTPLLLVVNSIWGEPLSVEIADFGQKKQVCPTYCTCEPLPPRPCSNWLSWDTWVDFLYWEAMEDNLEPAGIKESIILIGFSGLEKGPFLNMNFTYKPAFEVGLGVNFDHQLLDLRVDWIRYWNTSNVNGNGNQYYPMQLEPATLAAYLNGISLAGGGLGTAAPFSFNQTWKLEMNILDLLIGTLHKGNKIVEWHPYVGLRSQWINQFLINSYTANLVNGGRQVGIAIDNLHTTSWAIGARAGIDAKWLMGSGLFFYSNGAGDLLYTNGTYHGKTLALVPSAPPPGPVDWHGDVMQKNIQAIKPHLELELGFGWQAYLGCQESASIDLSAGYGFQVFFDQNMFRHFTTAFEEISLISAVSELVGVLATPISTQPDGSLYIHGLRVSLGFTY